MTPLGELLPALIFRNSKNEWERLGLLASAHAKPSFYNIGDEQGQVQVIDSLVYEKRNISRLQKPQLRVTYSGSTSEATDGVSMSRQEEWSFEGTIANLPG